MITPDLKDGTIMVRGKFGAVDIYKTTDDRSIKLYLRPDVAQIFVNGENIAIPRTVFKSEKFQAALSLGLTKKELQTLFETVANLQEQDIQKEFGIASEQ